jgi:sugar/nucleoside kinase (ribokinase family)
MGWDLAAVGEVLLDISVPALAPGQVTHSRIQIRPGGTPVNAAFAAAALGARSAVVGRVGADLAGSGIRAALAEAGVDALLAVDEEVVTGTFVETDVGGERAVAADRGASANLHVDDIPASLEAGAVLVSGYALLHDDSVAAAVAALARADAPWIAVSMGSAALVERCGADEVHARTTGANVFLANEAEASALTGREPDKAVAELARHYGVACVTKGPRGAVAAIRETRLERVAPAYASTAQFTGAGDAFAAAFLLSLVRGADLRDALAAACTAGVRLAARRTGTEPV